MMSGNHKGAVLALSGSLLWGIMGIACQYLMQDRHIPVWWLMCMRMIFAGGLLLVVDRLIYRSDMLAPWRQRGSAVQMVIFTYVTLLCVQFAYLQAVQHINAATATVFIGGEPIVILLWVYLRRWQLPKGFELACCISTGIGVALIATHGDFGSLAISPEGLMWGLSLPLAGAVYTAQPSSLMRRFRPSCVVGWGLFLCGITLMPFVQPWNVPEGMDLQAALVLVYTIVFGTAIAFWLFLSSLRFIRPHIASVYEMLEPLSAVILSIALFDIIFGWPELLGSVLILAPVVLLALKKESEAEG